MYIPRIYSAFLLSLSLAPQLSPDVPADAGFLCDKSAVLDATTKEGSCIALYNFRPVCVYTACFVMVT